MATLGAALVVLSQLAVAGGLSAPPRDLVVIGGGPVGVRAAVAAGSRGLSVALVDAPRYSGALEDATTGEDLSLGGPTGLFSKALRDVAKKLPIAALRGMGLDDRSIFSEMALEASSAAAASARDARFQLDTAGVELVTGFATLCEPDADAATVGVAVAPPPPDGDGARPPARELRARHVLLATGSSPFRPAGVPFDGRRVFDSDSINALGFLPRSVCITGSGIIALEFAKIFRNLGADVTLLVRDRVPMRALRKLGLDKDVAATLMSDLNRAGVKARRAPFLYRAAERRRENRSSGGWGE